MITNTKESALCDALQLELGNNVRDKLSSEYPKGDGNTKQHKLGSLGTGPRQRCDSSPQYWSLVSNHSAHSQMHRIPYALFFSLLLLISFPTQAIGDWTFRLKEEVVPPRGWVKLFNPPSSHTIRLRIGLPQLKFDELEKHLFEISDPNHHRYGKHLSKAEVEALVAPHKNSIDMVDGWLESFAIPRSHIARSPANDWITVNISLSLAEEMLNTVSP